MSGTKKIFVAIGITIALLIAAMTVAPLFFDINKKIRPILVSAMEKNLNAKVKMGDISLSLYGKVSFKISSLKIIKEKLTVDVTDLSMIMPYSVLTKNPTQWMKSIRMEIFADEISLNNRLLVISDLKTDFLKEESVIKLKNTEFHALKGRGTSYAQMEFSPGMNGLFEFEVRDGVWPVDKIKNILQQKIQNIPRADKLLSQLDISEKFESLKGSMNLENGITTIESISMNIPKNKAEAKASGTIDAKNNLKINGNIILPLDNVPAELKISDGRASIPFEVLGSTEAPAMNWDKTITYVVHAYSKDEGKKIIKEQVNRLKEKLMKDEKIKDFIKGIKF
jgi:hypothetical protein